MSNYNQHHKNLTGVSPKQSNITGRCCPLIKKMIAGALLILPLYLILFFIWYRFRHLIKIMVDVGDILNDDDFFGDATDAPKEGIEQHKKREYLKDVISMVKGHLLGHNCTYERVDKSSDETINMAYALYKQRDLNENGDKTGKTLGKHVINLYGTCISRWVKIRDVHKLCQDIENDPIINDQMAYLGCLLVSTLGRLLAPILEVAHTVNNLDLGNELENEDYESD